MKINEILVAQQNEAREIKAAATKAYREANRQIEEAKNKVMMEMFTRVLNSPEGLTAKEVVAQMGGIMSWQQASANLSLAMSRLGYASNPKRPQKFAATRKVRYEDALRRQRETKTKVFVEVDDNGMVKPNGETVTRTTSHFVYSSNK